MAKKNAQVNSTRQKAQQMREAQAKADKRTRNIIITVVSILSVAVVGAVIALVLARPGAETGGVPSSFEGGEPIVISAEGVGGLDPEAQDLTLYYDYSCSACAQLEVALAPNLTDGALEGEYNLLLQPVITVGMPFNEAATAAALTVAAKDPANFISLHEDMNAFFLGQLESQDGSIIQDLAQSEQAVADIARSVGVDEDIIAEFDSGGAANYLAESTKEWMASDVEDRENFATPEFVLDGKQYKLAGETAQEAYESLLAAISSMK